MEAGVDDTGDGLGRALAIRAGRDVNPALISWRYRCFRTHRPTDIPANANIAHRIRITLLALHAWEKALLWGGVGLGEAADLRPHQILCPPPLPPIRLDSTEGRHAETDDDS